jgi:hypothetical protein
MFKVSHSVYKYAQLKVSPGVLYRYLIHCLNLDAGFALDPIVVPHLRHHRK